MKIFKQLAAALLFAGVSLGLGSCDKNKNDEPISSFQVVKTEFDSSAKGGEGVITLTEGGFEVSTADAWVEAKKSGEKEVKLTITPNTDFESRVTNVLIKKDKQTLSVPITQLGIVAAVPVVQDRRFSKKGGEFDLEIALSDVEPVVTFEPQVDWASYTKQGNTYSFVVDANPALSPERRVQVKVVSGLVERTFSIMQKRGSDPALDPTAADIPGVYKLTYVERAGQTPKTAEIQIQDTNQPNTFLAYGAILPFVLHWFEEDARLTIEAGGQTLPPREGVQPGDVYRLIAFDGTGTVADGEDRNFVGIWDEVDKKRLKFTFTPNTAAYPFLLFVRYRGNSINMLGSDDSPYLMSNLVLEWQKPLPTIP